MRLAFVPEIGRFDLELAVAQLAQLGERCAVLGAVSDLFGARRMSSSAATRTRWPSSSMTLAFSISWS
ncbi:MAG TPA: hypothetical protein VG410_00325 [Solirubrobacteraceae bacterium]|nr:hypothetical protein [Solirubrobacteraceae bacterium]